MCNSNILLYCNIEGQCFESFPKEINEYLILLCLLHYKYLVSPFCKLFSLSYCFVTKQILNKVQQMCVRVNWFRMPLSQSHDHLKYLMLSKCVTE